MGWMRTARNNAPGVAYHVISRFVDREWFFNDDKDRALYLRLLAHALASSDWLCLAYALMSNHIHLSLIAGHMPLSSWAKPAHSAFAQAMNRRYGRLGGVFADRPKDFAVAPEKEGQLLAYIHNNPVRAGVVSQASESEWTSHRAYLGLVRSPKWLHVAEGLARAGFSDGSHFDAWVNVTAGESAEVQVDGVRRMVRRRGAINVGTPAGPAVPLMIRPFAHIRTDPRTLVRLVAEVVRVPEVVLCSRRRMPDAIRARRVVAHCGQAMGLTVGDIAAALGISRQSVSDSGRSPLDERGMRVYSAVCERLEVDGSDRGLCPSPL
jgi:putative transposase